MTNKNSSNRAIAEIARAAVESVRQRPEIAAAMRADTTLAGKMQAAARDAAAAETERCAKVVALCSEMKQPDQAVAMTASGKSLAEVEAVLRQKAVAASWDKATGNLNGHRPSEGAPAAGWDKVIAALPTQS